jgi:hypothetical protein
VQNIAELRAAGKCFKCREQWSPGHAKVYKGKQMYYVIVMENSSGQEEVAVVEDTTLSEDGEFQDAQQSPIHQISMHALCGTASMASTFTLKFHIGNKIATALVDTGSDISFMSAKFAVKSKCAVQNVHAIQVAAVDGVHMSSNSACLSYPYTIQGHKFSSDFSLLKVMM